MTLRHDNDHTEDVVSVPEVVTCCTWRLEDVDQISSEEVASVKGGLRNNKKVRRKREYEGKGDGVGREEERERGGKRKGITLF